jgi:ABC-type phosphate transport system substrate-binding protein
MGAHLSRVARGRVARLVLGIALLVGASVERTATQTAPAIAVIVHPDVSETNLTRAELRRLLLGDREFWSSGVRVTLLIRAPIAQERDAAVKGICEMSEAQFRQHWIGKVFRAETPSGPKIVYSAEMTNERVSHVPGAIAFVDAASVGPGVKVLKIDGKLPSQPGYTIR